MSMTAGKREKMQRERDFSVASSKTGKARLEAFAKIAGVQAKPVRERDDYTREQLVAMGWHGQRINAFLKYQNQRLAYKNAKEEESALHAVAALLARQS